MQYIYNFKNMNETTLYNAKGSIFTHHRSWLALAPWMAQIDGFIVNLKKDSVNKDGINVIDLKIKWFGNKHLVLYFVQLYFK